MSQLAQSPVAPVSCDVSDQLDYCDGVVCSLEVFGQGYKMELEVFSCTDPPSVHLTFRDLQDAVVYQHTFSDSEEVPVNLGVTVTLRFTLIHSNYSMTIRVCVCVCVCVYVHVHVCVLMLCNSMYVCIIFCVITPKPLAYMYVYM